jgi:hypothetical protein
MEAATYHRIRSAISLAKETGAVTVLASREAGAERRGGTDRRSGAERRQTPGKARRGL